MRAVAGPVPTELICSWNDCVARRAASVAQRTEPPVTIVNAPSGQHTTAASPLVRAIIARPTSMTTIPVAMPARHTLPRRPLLGAPADAPPIVKERTTKAGRPSGAAAAYAERAVPCPVTGFAFSSMYSTAPGRPVDRQWAVLREVLCSVDIL